MYKSKGSLYSFYEGGKLFIETKTFLYQSVNMLFNAVKL